MKSLRPLNAQFGFFEHIHPLCQQRNAHQIHATRPGFSLMLMKGCHGRNYEAVDIGYEQDYYDLIRQECQGPA